jgi:hypothetical protein
MVAMEATVLPSASPQSVVEEEGGQIALVAIQAPTEVLVAEVPQRARVLVVPQP